MFSRAGRTNGEFQHQVFKILVAAIFSAALISIASFVFHLLPFIHFGFDHEPSDGDALNLARRILTGLPIYTDWQSGHVLNIYTPFYYYLIAAADYIGLDPVRSGRALNIGFFGTSLVAVMMCCWFTFRRQSLLRASVGALAVLLIFRVWSRFTIVSNLKVDSTLFLMECLLATVLVLRPKHVGAWSALLSVLALFTKQAAMGPVIGTCLYFAFEDRKSFLRFATTGGITALTAIALLEVTNNGNFLNSAFFQLSKVCDVNWCQWRYIVPLLKLYYFGDALPLTILFLAFGIFAEMRDQSSLRPLLYLFVFDFAFSAYLGRNTGGGPWYFWFHWLLSCIFQARGLVFAFEFFESMKNRFLVLARAFAFIGVTALSFVIIQGIATSPRVDLSRPSDVSIRLQKQIAEIVNANPKSRWFSDRISMSIVRNGVLLDQEGAALGMVFRKGGTFPNDPLVTLFRSGSYDFVLTSSFSSPVVDQYSELFGHCYEVILDTQVSVFGGVYPAKVLKFKGGNTCRDP